MKIGQSAEVTRSFNSEDVSRYVTLGGAPMPAGVLPEPLVGALFSYLLGVELPGIGTNYLKQESEYLLPVPLDTPLTARVEITRLRPEKHLCDLSTVCTGPDGKVYCRGRALVYTEDVEQ